jgi:hypothetical protein
MTRETVSRTIESVEYDFIHSNAQMETIELLAKTLIEVRKHMTAHIPERVFDMVDDAIEKSGFKK